MRRIIASTVVLATVAASSVAHADPVTNPVLGSDEAGICAYANATFYAHGGTAIGPEGELISRFGEEISQNVHGGFVEADPVATRTCANFAPGLPNDPFLPPPPPEAGPK
jgi:hypothetical protein